MRIEPEDIEICTGGTEDPAAAFGSLTPPVVQTSLFAHESLESLHRGLSSEHEYSVYTRGKNPTVRSFESKLAGLERGEECQAFASGMGAIAATMFSLVSRGDHVLFVNHVYGPTLQLAEQLRRFGVEHDRAVQTDIESVAKGIKPNTRLLWLESPGTMLNRVADVPAIATLARERGILSVMDNSWATPLLQKPLTAGIDVVVHTCTKYIGGHSDTVGGALVTSRQLYRRIFHHGYLLLGSALGPWDAWLLIRGLRTLPIRLMQHEQNALAIGQYLANHRAVSDVYHPAFTGDRGIVDRQLSGFSGLLSFRLRDDRYESVARVVNSLRRFRIGVSWGGVESLVLSPQRPDNDADLEAAGIMKGVIRLSLGIEDSDSLIADLDRALAVD